VGVMAMFARHPFTQFAGEALAAVADGIAVGIERKRADEALRRSEDRFREMAEHIKEAFFDVDLATGTALYVSPTWAEIWGRRLAGGVAHDFNNLLTAMLGSADLVLETLAPGAPERDDVQEIRKAALRAGELTRQLLAFSRQQVLAPRVLDLNALAANMEKLL